MAVTAVVVDHLFSWPSGGFVGVDVFFVISGFLITSLLLREHDKTGTISFTGFYKRRAKRILPASTLVLLVTVAASFLLFNAGRAQQTLWDGISALFFGANWRFIAAGTDYFEGSGPVSPLQHFWSLAVEEQFYFVWPWLMLLIFLLGGRATRLNTTAAHRAIGVAMIAITITSFAWALVESISNPTWAYFSTLSRAWELGLGALVAVATPLLLRVPNVIRPVISWVGVAGITISVFLITDEMPFPAPWAALPVIATALVIAAGTGGEQRFLWPLTNRVAGYVGDISYSLYLWHFPVVIFLAVLIPGASLITLLIGLFVMLVLSVLSFELIEDPIRRSTWMTGMTVEQKARVARNRRRSQRSAHATRTKAIFLTLGVTSVVILVAIALTPRGPISNYQRPAEAATEEGTASAQTAETALASRISAALNASAWPELNPDIGNLSKELNVPEWVVDGCLGDERNALEDPVENALRCKYGNPEGPKQAVLL